MCISDFLIFPSYFIMDSAADILKQLPSDYHYVFDLVHFILCIQGDRADLGDGYSVVIYCPQPNVDYIKS